MHRTLEMKPDEPLLVKEDRVGHVESSRKYSRLFEQTSRTTETHALGLPWRHLHLHSHEYITESIA